MSRLARKVLDELDENVEYFPKITEITTKEEVEKVAAWYSNNNHDASSEKIIYDLVEDKKICSNLEATLVLYTLGRDDYSYVEKAKESFDDSRQFLEKLYPYMSNSTKEEIGFFLPSNINSYIECRLSEYEIFSNHAIEISFQLSELDVVEKLEIVKKLCKVTHITGKIIGGEIEMDSPLMNVLMSELNITYSIDSELSFALGLSASENKEVFFKEKTQTWQLASLWNKFMKKLSNKPLGDIIVEESLLVAKNVASSTVKQITPLVAVGLISSGISMNAHADIKDVSNTMQAFVQQIEENITAISGTSECKFNFDLKEQGPIGFKAALTIGDHVHHVEVSGYDAGVSKSVKFSNKIQRLEDNCIMSDDQARSISKTLQNISDKFI
jgi:hypothetical protein